MYLSKPTLLCGLTFNYVKSQMKYIPLSAPPPDDWRQTDFAHRFPDELKAINDSAAANFDSAKKLTEYTGDERKQLAYASAEAFRAMDFDSNESKVEAALDLSHTLLNPVA